MLIGCRGFIFNENYGFFEGYDVGAKIVGFLVFFVVSAYSVFQWGFLLGLALGWVPAFIAAVLAAFVWPLIVLVIVIIVFFMLK